MMQAVVAAAVAVAVAAMRGTSNIAASINRSSHWRSCRHRNYDGKKDPFHETNRTLLYSKFVAVLIYAAGQM
jgi:fatty-acid desaturase